MRRFSGMKAAIYAVLIFSSFAAVFPLYHIAVTSAKSNTEYLDNKAGLPENPTLESYRFIIQDGGMLGYFVNNFILIPLGVAAYICVCLAAGFAFGKLRFRLKLPLFMAVLFLMIFPQMLLAIQVFRLSSVLGLVNTYLGVVLVWTAYFAPFGTYIMTTYFAAVPYELVESARIDGASTFRILVSIMAPVAAPMLGTLAIIGVQSMWNELPFSLLLLQDGSKRTVSLAIAMLKGEYGLRAPDLSAAVAIASAVPILLFIIFQRKITLGSLAGSVKG
jgi:multiple sugar transport system permease protein/raffinose/stachyose/melibiose transport system permease protein